MEFFSESDFETRQFGAQFSKQLKPGAVVCLTGDLGAGKTTFTKGIAAGLGIKYEPVSPTFNLVNAYDGVIPLYHFDLYRLQSTEDLMGIDFDSYLFSGGVCVIEWRKIAYPLLEHYYQVQLLYEGENRRIIIEEVRK